MLGTVSSESGPTVPLDKGHVPEHKKICGNWVLLIYFKIHIITYLDSLSIDYIESLRADMQPYRPAFILATLVKNVPTQMMIVRAIMT